MNEETHQRSRMEGIDFRQMKQEADEEEKGQRGNNKGKIIRTPIGMNQRKSIDDVNRETQRDTHTHTTGTEKENVSTKLGEKERGKKVLQ